MAVLFGRAASAQQYDSSDYLIHLKEEKQGIVNLPENEVWTMPQNTAYAPVISVFQPINLPKKALFWVSASIAEIHEKIVLEIFREMRYGP